MAFLAGLFSKKAVPWLLAALLIAVGGMAARSAVGKVSDLIDDRVASARAERDAFWRAEVEKANAALAGLVAESARQAMLSDSRIRAVEQAANENLDRMEKDNAALPGGDDCGLSAERVQLLPR